MYRVSVFVTMCTIAAAIAVIGATPALADKVQPPKDAATSVYVEQIPTGSGSVAAGAKGRKTKLAASVQRKLKQLGGSDAKALENLATKSGLGAPTTTVASPKAHRPTAPRHDARSASAVPLSGGSSGGGGRLLVLVAVLGIVGLASIGAAVRMRRGRDH